MDDASSIDEELRGVAAEAVGAAEEAVDTTAAAAEEILTPKGDLEQTLSDALASVRRAIVEQPITAVLLVGAFAFLWGHNRRS